MNDTSPNTAELCNAIRYLLEQWSSFGPRAREEHCRSYLRLALERIEHLRSDIETLEPTCARIGPPHRSDAEVIAEAREMNVGRRKEMMESFAKYFEENPDLLKDLR